MADRKSIPNAVTVFNTFVSSLALLAAFKGSYELSIRLIFVCMSLDVLDGLLARKLNAMSDEGELLDRVTDRIYQVLIPSLIYVNASSWSLTSQAYAALIITISFWRLVRKVPSKDKFAGLPLFAHTLVIIFGYLGGCLLPGYAMIIMAVLSAVPVPYFRRLRTGGPSETRGTLWQLRISAPILLAFIPYASLSPLFRALLIIAAFYVAFGWVPPLLLGKRSVKAF